MRTRHAQFLILALAGALFTPMALAGPGHHARHHQGNSGIVIYFGSTHGSHVHSARSKPPSHSHYQQGYRQGYRDGFHAGSRHKQKHSNHRHERHVPTWKQRYAHVLPSNPHGKHHRHR